MKIKSNHKGWNLKVISINKRIRKTKNNKEKNKDRIWYKNQMSMDEIEKKI